MSVDQFSVEVWLSVVEASALAGLNRKTVYKWIREGKVRDVRGRRGSYRVRLAELLPPLDEKPETARNGQ